MKETTPVMRGEYLLMYEGRRKGDPDEPCPDIRQAYCARCGKLWNLSRMQESCPYFCPECEKRKEQRYGKEENKKRSDRGKEQLDRHGD